MRFKNKFLSHHQFKRQTKTNPPAWHDDITNFFESDVKQIAGLGEGLNQFRKVEQSISIENDKQIVAFKN